VDEISDSNFAVIQWNAGEIKGDTLLEV